MSNRFPADDEHLHPYPGNLKHHKVEKDFFHVEKEERRKLLCEMMKDDAKSGLYDERKREPLLSGDVIPVKLRSPEEVDAMHERARAKDAELIQRLVDGLKHAQKFAEEYGYGPLETVQWDLDAAAAAGFKPSE